MRYLKKTLALALSVAMIFTIPTPAMAMDGDLPLDSGAVIGYRSSPNESYVSMDLTEAKPVSDFFVVVSSTGTNVPQLGAAPTIVSVLKDMGDGKTAVDTALQDALALTPIAGPDPTFSQTRFEVIPGKTPPVGVYFVTLEIPMVGPSDSSTVVSHARAGVELHINSGDPSHLIGNEVSFYMDFDGKAKELISQPVKIKNPSDTKLTPASTIRFYEISSSSNQLELLSYMSATNITEDSFCVKVTPVNGVLTVPRSVFYTLPTKARSVFTPVFMSTCVYINNPDALLELVYEKELQITQNDPTPSTQVEVKNQNGIAMPITKITILKNTLTVPDAIDVGSEPHIIKGYEAATATFQAEYLGPVTSPGYDIKLASLIYKDRPITVTGTAPQEASAQVRSIEGTPLNLNSLDENKQYPEIRMRATATDETGNPVIPSGVVLGSTTAAPEYFEIVDGSQRVNQDEQSLDFAVRLKNDSNVTIDNLDIRESVTIQFDNGRSPEVESFTISAFAGQPNLYLTEVGSTDHLSEESDIPVPMGTSKKLELHLEGFHSSVNDSKTTDISCEIVSDSNELHNPAFSLVRGQIFPAKDGEDLTETITLRYNAPTAELDMENVYLLVSLVYKPQITNQDVLLSVDVSTAFYSTTVSLLPADAPTPPNPDPDPDPDDNGDDSSAPAPKGNSPVNTVLTPAAVTENVLAPMKNAVSGAVANKQGSTDARISFWNYTSITPESVRNIVDAAAKATAGTNVKLNLLVNFDQVKNGAVTLRIAVDPVALSTAMNGKEVLLGARFDQKDGEVQKMNALLSQKYDNRMITVVYDQKSPLAVSAEFAAKLDFSSLGDPSQLRFYSYNPQTGKSTKIDTPNYWVDSKGYVHITAPLGGVLIITNKALVEK